MLNVDQALETILSHVKTLDVKERPLLRCLGQTLAGDIYADIAGYRTGRNDIC